MADVPDWTRLQRRVRQEASVAVDEDEAVEVPAAEEVAANRAPLT